MTAATSESTSSSAEQLGEIAVVQPLTEDIYMDVDDPTPAGQLTFSCHVVWIVRDAQVATDAEGDVPGGGKHLLCAVGSFTHHGVMDNVRPAFESPQNVALYWMTIHQHSLLEEDGDVMNARSDQPEPQKRRLASLALWVAFDTTIHLQYRSPTKAHTGVADDSSPLPLSEFKWLWSLQSWSSLKDFFSLTTRSTDQLVDVMILPPVMYDGRLNQ